MTTDLDRHILESLESGVLWFDRALRLVDANLAAREGLGLGDGPLYLTMRQLGWKPADERGNRLPEDAWPVRRAMRLGALAQAVVVVQAAQRGERWLRVRALPLAGAGDGDGDGTGPAVVVTYVDFTEERAAMRSLQESEQLLRMFGQHALDLMWIVDPRERKLLYINAAYERIWGRSPAPLFEDLSHWLDGADPEDRQRVADAAQHPNAAGMYESEYRVHRPDGRMVWVRGRGFPLFDGDGRMRYMAGFAEDVTLARANAQLQRTHRETQERLERLVATAPGAVHSYRREPDGRGHFVFASPAIHDLLGVEADALADGGVDLVELVHPDDRAAVRHSLAASAAHGSAWLAVFRVPRTPAGLRWIEVHAMPVREPGGAVVWHGFLIDITERRRAEEEIRLLNIELERRVAERTSELEAKHREMEAFTYSVSHDLKAPLRGIDGYSRLLESDCGEALDEDGRFFVAMIRKATGQMGELIDDLLAYSRIERGRPKLVPVDAAKVMASVVAASAAEIADGGVELTQSLEPGVAVQGEHEGLVLVLRNLVDNALKFTAGRPVRAIEVGVRREPAGALFWVRDNGVGFDMRYHDRIFEIFQRLHRAEDYPGTGVGLAIVRKAVERMHGKVWAQSAPGAGATFSVRLPVA